MSRENRPADNTMQAASRAYDLARAEGATPAEANRLSQSMAVRVEQHGGQARPENVEKSIKRRLGQQ